MLEKKDQTLIFKLACTDGGRTGRSLAVVSRRVRAISESVRNHSITVIGATQMLTFADLLHRLPPARRVQHLFISDHVLDEPFDYDTEYLKWHPNPTGPPDTKAWISLLQLKQMPWWRR